jgi:hypothetical protein
MTYRTTPEKEKGRTRRTQTRFTKTTHKSNPGGHNEDRASIPAAIFGSYTKSRICGPLSQETLRGGKNLGKEEAKIKEVREIGDPSSYLIGLLHYSSFAYRYFESNHLTQGHCGPT